MGKNILAIDLTAMESISSFDHGVKYLFCVVDTVTKYAWVKPLTKCKPNTGWPTKMSLFFFGNNFYKNKETFKIFSPQILEVYRILLV